MFCIFPALQAGPRLPGPGYCKTILISRNHLLPLQNNFFRQHALIRFHPDEVDSLT